MGRWRWTGVGTAVVLLVAVSAAAWLAVWLPGRTAALPEWEPFQVTTESRGEDGRGGFGVLTWQGPREWVLETEPPALWYRWAQNGNEVERCGPAANSCTREPVLPPDRDIPPLDAFSLATREAVAGGTDGWSLVEQTATARTFERVIPPGFGEGGRERITYSRDTWLPLAWHQALPGGQTLTMQFRDYRPLPPT